jgi:hypothetical protein
VKPVILTPEPYKYLSEVPDSVDWRNYNNTNYCGKVLNQKNPNVCGSCWAHASTGALADRYNIATNNKFTSTLAPQNLINFNLRYNNLCDVLTETIPLSLYIFIIVLILCLLQGIHVLYSSVSNIVFVFRTTGGTCEGGDHIKAYDFIHKYGISDDNCMPYAGVNWRHGFHVAALTEVDDVQDAMCHTCSWDGNCAFIPK